VRTRIFASVTLWLAAVVSVAAIAWLAIDAAGRQVTASPVSASVPTRTPVSPTLGPSPTSPEATTVSPSSAATSSPAAATSSPVSTGVRPTTAKPTGWPANPAGGPRSGPPTVVMGSYSTIGGRLRVTCRGHAITLGGGYAQPASGWSVRVQSTGPWLVQVVFEQNDQQALLVSAVCADGHPQFDTDRIEAGAPPTGH
jgi:hypothetical protein